MLEPEHLNPNDVLAHLEALGFQNVTPRQLKDFIHDLKKLIKYEQKHLQRDCQNLEAGDFECSCRRSDDNCDEQLSNDICSSSDISDCTSTTYKNCKNEKLVNESKFKSGATENYLFKTQSSC